MKLAVALVFAAVAVLQVSANGQEGSFSSEEWGMEGRGGCRCPAGRRNPCTMTNPPPPAKIGCPGSNGYLTCSGTTCSNNTCPSNQVWNETVRDCASCADGMQVSTNLQRCVCKTGTTPDEKTKSCVPCPKFSVELPDMCFCNKSVYALDKVNMICKSCPVNSTLRNGKCMCDKNLFWKASTWTCETCPGTWVAVGRRSTECQCTGQVFDEVNVSCFTCPQGSTVDNDGDYCNCNVAGQVFDMVKKQCACGRGLVPNANNDGCVRAPTTTTKAP